MNVRKTRMSRWCGPDQCFTSKCKADRRGWCFQKGQVGSVSERWLCPRKWQTCVCLCVNIWRADRTQVWTRCETLCRHSLYPHPSCLDPSVHLDPFKGRGARSLQPSLAAWRVRLGRRTKAAPSEVSPPPGLHRTPVPFLPKGSRRTTASHSPGSASVLRGRALLSGQLGSFKGLRVPAAESGRAVNSRSPRGGEHTRSAPRWLARPWWRETSLWLQAGGTQLPPYPFLNSLFSCKSPLISTAYLYLPASSFLFGDTNRPDEGKRREKCFLQCDKETALFYLKIHRCPSPWWRLTCDR